MTEDTADQAQPLTVLAEDETIFRDSVRAFAEARIRPLVREMDEHAKIPRTLIDELFELGVMGIEVPEAYGGAGGRFFHSVLAVEELSRVDPSIGVLVDVQNTLVINAHAPVRATTSIKRPLAAGARGGHRRRLRAVGGRLRQRRLRAHHARARGRRRLRPQRPQALDHQRQRSQPLHRLCDGQSRRRLPRHHRLPRRARRRQASPSARRKTSSASARAARAS